MLNKRLFDLIISLTLIVLLFIPILMISFLVMLTSPGPIIYWSERVGLDNVIFRMPKFRSMNLNTPSLASHLMKDSKLYLTPIGGFLRRFSLDELPQLFSTLKGDMSFIGPRPALFNQEDLIAQRTAKGVEKILPGLTGWAQVNGRDILSISQKVALDVEYMNNQSFCFDLKILWMTFLKVVKQVNVSH